MAQHYLWGINRIEQMLEHEQSDHDFMIAMATFSVFNSMACAINGKHGENPKDMSLQSDEWEKARKYIELNKELTNDFLWKLARNPISHNLFTADNVIVSRSLPLGFNTTEHGDYETNEIEVTRNLHFSAVSWFRTVERGFKRYLRDLADKTNKELRKNLVAYMTNGAISS